MYKPRLLFFLFAALFVIILSSCNKDDDVAPNKNQLLIAHAWQGSDTYINGYRDDDNSIPLDIKSLKVTFKDDRTFTATYKISGNPQTMVGLWDLKENGTKINFPILNVPGDDSELMRLTANNFDVSTIFTRQDGTKQAIELRFVPAK